MKRNLPRKISSYLLFLLFFLFFHFDSSALTCGITGDSVVCAGDVETYSTSVTGPYSYQWSAFGGTATPSGSSAVVTWGNTLSGQVTLVVRDAANNIVCTSVMNVTLNSKPIPMITPSSEVGCGKKQQQHTDGKKTENAAEPGRKGEDDCASICDSTWVTYSTPNHPGSTYSWVITGAANYSPSTTNSINVYWTAPGAGTVQVIETNAYGCVGVAQICVTIVAKPHAQFTSLTPPVGGIIYACLGTTLTFIDLSNAGAGTNLLSYQWDFGDGGSASGTYPYSNSVTHSYTAPGTYTVTLTIENECHCKDVYKLKVVISSDPGPKIECVSTVCPGATVTYHTDPGCGTYNWSVTNGAIVGSNTNPDVTVTWGSTGPGTLTVAVTGCGGICTTPTTVQVPIISPSATINGQALVCYGQCYTYHISCNIPIDEIHWHLPPGVTLAYPGIVDNTHEVTLCFYDPTFTSGTIDVDYYHNTPGSADGLSCGGHSSLVINQRPQMYLNSVAQICDKAAYTASISPATTGNVKWTITDLTGGTIYLSTILPTTASLSIPSWTFGPGSFLITVTALSGQYCNSPQKTTLLVNPLPPPPASITGPDPVCPNIPYTYLATPTSTAYSIQWTVTNGTPATGAGNTISVKWNASGPYTLTATQIDPVTGCVSDPISKTVSPATGGSVPVFGNTTPCANSTQPYNVAAGTYGEDFVWSISPDAAGSVTNGQHTGNISILWNNYTGPATIKLIRTVCGIPYTSLYNVNVISAPTPSITVPATGCQGASIAMSTTTSAVSYSWNFGDGGTGSGPNPSHIYTAAGSYVVTLTVTYGGSCPGTASVTAPIMIYPQPNVTISTPDPNIYCGTIPTVHMFVAAPVAGVTYNWYRTPGGFLPPANATTHNDNVRGTYYVIATNSYGCTNTSNTIIIDTSCGSGGCTPNPSYSVNFTKTRTGCNNDNFNAVYTPGAINPSWNFDDPFGPTTAFGNSVSHTFKEPGYYRVRLCMDVPNSTGTGYCTICKVNVDTIQYVPDFYDSLYCVSASHSIGVKFLNNTKRLATLPVPSYSWLIMPGSITSTLPDPSFVLAANTYTVSLSVAGMCTVTKTVVVPPYPTASFTANDSICVLAGIPFTNTSPAGSYTSQSWTFGDGSSSLVNNPTRVYTNPGLYTVKLTITNSFGCSDFTTRNVRVVPNTLNGFIVPGTDTSLCEGDSIKLTVNATGGYPGYSYLWSTVQSTQSIWAKYTGAYTVDITDSKRCFKKTAAENVLVYPVPRPQISGNTDLCAYTYANFSVNYPSTGGYTIAWFVDGANQFNPNSTFQYYPYLVGGHTVTVKVTSPTGCVGQTTINIVIHTPPTASIASSGSMCEGTPNTLTGSSPSPGIINTYWNTGATTSTIVTSIPGTYTYTVVDQYGCTASASTDIHELPDFCGMLTGCYNICDTVRDLVWYAPTGYASYQWYYNGSPIAGETSPTIHIPLYQSGEYWVEIKTIYGCIATCAPIDITFVKCGDCQIELEEPKVVCGPIDTAGNQTYFVSFNLYNSMGGGTLLSISTTSGTITGLTPGTLSPGWNPVSFTYTDLPPFDGLGCITIMISNKEMRCSKTGCIKLPKCQTDCDEKIEVRSFDCAGYDAAGNPQYTVCTDVYWGGSNGSLVTILTPEGTVVPNPITINNGWQTICYTFTDLPPYNTIAGFTYSFYDSRRHTICKDKFEREYKPCPDKCKIDILGLCVYCKGDNGNGEINYAIQITLNNPYAIGYVNISPIAAGTFSAVSPNPIGAGIQVVDVVFTDNLPTDSVICFRVLVNDDQGNLCWQDVCVYLPACDQSKPCSNGTNTGIESLSGADTRLSVSPNPASDQFKVYYTVPYIKDDLSIDIIDITGKVVNSTVIGNRTGLQEFNNMDLKPGVYFINLRTPDRVLGHQRLVIVK